MPDPTTLPGQVRVGDAERERVASQLADHHAAGRLTLAELDDRLGAALSARTRDDLTATLVELPQPTAAARPAAAQPSVPAAGVVWRSHLVTYVAVIAGLWLIWAVTGFGYPWPIWPMLGWGLGVFGHRTGMTACGRTRALARG